MTLANFVVSVMTMLQERDGTMLCAEMLAGGIRKVASFFSSTLFWELMNLTRSIPQVLTTWDGTALVIDPTGDQGRALDAARLALSSDEKTMTPEYERKSPDDPEKRYEIYEKR
jgi:hypothetical protein